MKGADDEESVNGFPTTGSIFQNFLSLLQKNKCSFEIVVANILHPGDIILNYSFRKHFYINDSKYNHLTLIRAIACYSGLVGSAVNGGQHC